MLRWFKPKTLWVVGKVLLEKGVGVWEFVGVYSSRDKAVSVCQTRYFFLAPVVLNTTAPDETTIWPGAEYLSPDIPKPAYEQKAHLTS